MAMHLCTNYAWLQTSEGIMVTCRIMQRILVEHQLCSVIPIQICLVLVGIKVRPCNIGSYNCNKFTTFTILLINGVVFDLCSHKVLQNSVAHAALKFIQDGIVNIILYSKILLLFYKVPSGSCHG